jgi:hypothetical protein
MDMTRIAGGAGGIALICLLFVLAASVSAVVGGLVGAGVAIGYNGLLGWDQSVRLAAVIGSIVGLIGGASVAE